MTEQSNTNGTLSELEREKQATEAKVRALDEAIAVYREIHDKLANLPPDLAGKVVDSLKPSPPAVVGGPPAQRQPEPDSSDNSLAGKTSAECAQIILKDHGNAPMHFAEIAKEALRRGYSGQGSEEKDVGQTAREFRAAQGFWAMLHRAKTVFEKLPHGQFKLKPGGGERLTPDLMNATAGDLTGARPGASLPMQIAKLLKSRGEPMRGADIATVLEGAGVKTGSQRGLLAMVFSALRKRKDIFQKVGRGTYRLKSPDEARAKKPVQVPSAGDEEGLFSDEVLGPCGNDLAGLSVVEAAIKVMREHPGRSMSYREIATIANRRGYSSGRSDSEATLMNSFRELLRRNSALPGSLIRRVGGGQFRLRDERAPEQSRPQA